MPKSDADEYWDKVSANLPKGDIDYWHRLEVKAERKQRWKANPVVTWLGYIVFILGVGVVFATVGLFGPPTTAPAPFTFIFSNPAIGCTGGLALVILGAVVMRLSVRRL